MLPRLLGCDATASRPQAQPKRPAATSKPRPPASLPMPAKPEPSAPVWRVVSVRDGDTLRAIDQGKTERKVRLVGIDAPEIGQAFGTKARDGLTAIVKGKSVEVHADSEDRYGRTLARLVVGGQDVNLAMVAEGLAWHFTRYSDDAVLAAAEREARAARRGLWADPEPVAPWDWRATEKDQKPAPAAR
jgi:micrococcal nuclease